MSPDGAGGYRVEADGCALSQRAIDGVAQVEEPGERGGAPGARGGVALASAHPGLHGSAQMENPTKASTATLRTIIAIAATSMLVLRLDAMRHFWQQSSDRVDLDHGLLMRRGLSSRHHRDTVPAIFDDIEIAVRPTQCPLCPIATKFRSAGEMTRCAMCGRLRVGKSFLHVAGLVSAAMCSACRCGSHDRWP